MTIITFLLSLYSISMRLIALISSAKTNPTMKNLAPNRWSTTCHNFLLLFCINFTSKENLAPHPSRIWHPCPISVVLRLSDMSSDLNRPSLVAPNSVHSVDLGVSDLSRPRWKDMHDSIAWENMHDSLPIEWHVKSISNSQLVDAPLSGENLGVTSVIEEIEMEAEMDRSIEPVEIEVKGDFVMSIAHGEENLIDTSLSETIGNMEEMEITILSADSGESERAQKEQRKHETKSQTSKAGACSSCPLCTRSSC